MDKMKAITWILVLTGLLLAAMPASAGLSGWQYQQEITIQENSGKTLHDYQVLVELAGSDFPGEAQPDGDDIRFTDVDGRELSYWTCEFDAGSKRARIWVKVPLIQANGEAKVMMWYGNPSAESASDGDAVFEFFDDFSGLSLNTNKWDITGSPYIDSSWLHASGGQSLLSTSPVAGPYVLEAKCKQVTMPAGRMGKAIGDGYVIYYDDTKNMLQSYFHNHGGNYWREVEVAGGSTHYYNVPIIENAVTTYSLKIYSDGVVFRTYRDGSLITSRELTNYFVTSGKIGIGVYESGEYLFDDVRVRKYTSIEPTITIGKELPTIYTTISIIKSPSPHSIRQFQETTITLSIKNSGTTDATDIEITDAIHPSFDLVSGDFPNPKRYDLIRPGETRDLQYTISAKESGTFTLDPATVTYADEDGNIQEATSEPASIKVIPSTEGGTAGGTSHTPSVSTASVQLHGEKTNVVLGEDILLKLSAVNLITKPTMHVQVIIIPPSGMSVTSSAFAKSGAGQYTTTYELEPGTGKDIEVAIRSNQVGDFDVNGRIIYYFGDDREDAEDHTLILPINVRAEAEPGAERTQSPSESERSSTPGFEAVFAAVGVLLVALLTKRRRVD